MKNILNFYIDDSGTRHPTQKVGKKAAHGNDWFAFGGILINQSDEELARSLHKEFCQKWKISSPLHSSEIRSGTGNFKWLRSCSEDNRSKFYEELYCLLRDSPVLGLSCVIDRPGYCERYLELYQKQPWELCKTAFNVVLERSVKLAISREQKLRIYIERCNKKEDKAVTQYYSDLKSSGMPFARSTSEKYQPLEPDDFKKTLYDFKTKAKSSPLVQLADLYLWPMCMGGYKKSTRPYKRLLDDGKLIECIINEEDHSMLATKYSCFENVKVKP